MTAPTAPTAPLPSELQEALNRHALFVSCEYKSTIKKDWSTIHNALLTMQRERDEAAKQHAEDDAIHTGLTIAEYARLHEEIEDLEREAENNRGLQEKLAASERTCAEAATILYSAIGADCDHRDLCSLAKTIVEEKKCQAKRAEAAERTVEGLRERGDVEVCCAQAVEFAEYVTEHAKGKMVEAAQRFLSLPYSQELSAKLKRATRIAHPEGGDALKK